MWELIVEHHDDIPGLMQPLRGKSRDATELGHVVRDHLAQLHTPSSPTYLGADRAL
jgi:hypothetical protein